MKAKNLVVAVAVVLFGFVSSTSASFLWPTEAVLDGQFDFGDVAGNFNTEGQTMYVNLRVSDGHITYVGVNVDRAAWLDMPGEKHFQIHAYINGTYDMPPTPPCDGVFQNLTAEHKGILIEENASLNSYENNGTWENGSASATLTPLTITYGDGQFHDSSWDCPDGTTQHTFDWNVLWNGYTTDPLATTAFSSVQPLSISAAVPEPPTLVLLLVAAVLLLEVKDYLDRQKITRIPTDKRNPKK